MCVSILRPIRVVKKYLAARTSRSAPKLGTRAIVDSPYIDRRTHDMPGGNLVLNLRSDFRFFH